MTSTLATTNQLTRDEARRILRSHGFLGNVAPSLVSAARAVVDAGRPLYPLLCMYPQPSWDIDDGSEFDADERERKAEVNDYHDFLQAIKRG